jgi:hypothetical protein
MKTKFHGYYTPTSDDFDKLWNDALFSFDANVLLHLYGYSERTRDEVLELLKQFRDKIWLSYQAADEYQRNRADEIHTSAKKYEELQATVTKVTKALTEHKQHPFIADDLLLRFSKVIEEVQNALEDGFAQLKAFRQTDPIRDKLDSIFDGRVGDALPPNELEEIFRQGAKRYGRKVPPGYEDDKKPEPDKFGDLIIWNELMRFAKEKKRAIIFVTDDAKKDWWLHDDVGKLGPRPELLHEFRGTTGQNCYLYSFDKFVELAKHYHKKISEAAVKEVKDVATERREAFNKAEYLTKLHMLRNESEEELRARYVYESPFKQLQDTFTRFNAQSSRPFSELLEKLAQSGVTPYSRSDLDEFVKQFKESGVPSRPNILDELVKRSKEGADLGPKATIEEQVPDSRTSTNKSAEQSPK